MDPVWILGVKRITAGDPSPTRKGRVKLQAKQQRNQTATTLLTLPFAFCNLPFAVLLPHARL
jgi:hypothetical protein